MSKKLDPIISEFETQEQADAYDAWFRDKVEQALNEPGATYSHDEVMARVDEVIKQAAGRKPALGGDDAGRTDLLDPLVSEFETQAQADSYERWFLAKVEKSLADSRPSIPHDEAMARADEAIRRAAKRTT